MSESRQSVFKALADPTRRSILKTLQKGSLAAGDIAEAFPITRASLSHHFNVLKTADLVRTERRGQHIVYSLNTTVLQEAAAAVLDIFAPGEEPSETARRGRQSKQSRENRRK